MGDFQIFFIKLKNPEENVDFLSEFIVIELEKRNSFKKVIRIAEKKAKNIEKILGIRIQISGRLNGAEIARKEWTRKGRVPLHTIYFNVEYTCKTAKTIYGNIGVKFWIFFLDYFFFIINI